LCTFTISGTTRGPFYGTRKNMLLESVRRGVTTRTFPVVAPGGTVVVISVAETTVNVAAVPLKLGWSRQSDRCPES
jgi:hypothetical protein